jgi:hypothetical protein
MKKSALCLTKSNVCGDYGEFTVVGNKKPSPNTLNGSKRLRMLHRMKLSAKGE